MKILIKLLILIITNFTYLVHGQDTMLGSRIILTLNSPSGGNSFYVYNPTFKAKAIYRDFSEVKNEYPEELLSSILSASNQTWYDFNILESSGLREKKAIKHFENVMKMDREKTYMELICKFQFQYEGTEMAIIKFLFHIEEKDTVCGAYVMQKINSKWYKTATPFTNDLSVLMIRMKVDKLEQILTAIPNGDKYVSDVINKIKKADGSSSIFKLVEEFKSWYANNDRNKISYFKDPKSW